MASVLEQVRHSFHARAGGMASTPEQVGHGYNARTGRP